MLLHEPFDATLGDEAIINVIRFGSLDLLSYGRKQGVNRLKKSLIQKQNFQYRIGNPLLLMFSTPFIVWQMGVLYYSGTTMSLFGRTPIPLTEENTIAVIAAGYLLSILALCLFPRMAVKMERIIMPIALAATMGMLLPLPGNIITILFYIEAFVCVFSIGAIMSVAAHHLTLGTTWRDGIISTAVGGVLIAVLQNEFYNISFTAFTLLSVVLIALQTVFFYLLPEPIEAPFVSRKSRTRMPRVLFIGIWLIIGFSTLLLCFAGSYAESVENGVSVLYLSAAIMAVLLFIIRTLLGSNSVRVFGAFFAVSVFGFVLTFLSISIPSLRIVSCVLLGFVVVLASLWMFFAAVSFKIYATRFIGPLAAATGLFLALLHSGLQELLRDNIALLYGIYAALSVALLVVYYSLEPYFISEWTKRSEGSEPLAQLPPERRPSSPFDILSEQERILAGLILAGHSETSAAQSMNITLNTQKGYRKNLYFKLGIHSKRELFELAKEK